jgi:hypothetical protein
MAHDISEADWKRFRQLHPIALERFCDRALTDVGRLMADTQKSAHERYLGVFKLVKSRDKELAQAFNDLRRSTATLQLALIRAWGLVGDEEVARFSPEMQAALQRFMDV